MINLFTLDQCIMELPCHLEVHSLCPGFAHDDPVYVPHRITVYHALSRGSDKQNAPNLELADETESAPHLPRAIVKTTMTALLRSSMVADTLRHLATELEDHLNLFEPSAVQICHMLKRVGVRSDPQLVEEEVAALLHGAPGVSMCRTIIVRPLAVKS